LYSAAARFTGGTPGAVRVPTATDQQVIAGGGTDAAPTYTTFHSGLASARVHIVCQSTAVSGVYAIHFAVCQLSSTNCAGAFLLEPIQPGSFLADNDPCVLGFTSGSTTIAFSGWIGYGTGSVTWVSGLTVSNLPYTGSLGTDLTSGNDVNGYPEISGTAAGAIRIKGILSYCAFKGPARNYPSTANRTTDARLYWNGYVLLFADNTEPLVS
jgi:hypothetical protein